MTEDVCYTYRQYNADILSGKIASCKSIYLACKRFESWMSRTDIYFDEECVQQKIRIISKLRHYTGKHNGKRFMLLPWQQWCIANIFGWKYVSNNSRVTKNVFIMISRKAGKTAFAAAIGILCSLDKDDNGAEVDLVANSRQQAHIAFEHTSKFCESVDPRKKVFKRYRDTIKVPQTSSTIQILSSDSMGNDGYSPSCFILDEFHAQRDWSLYNVMKSGQGYRSSPLAIVITTAGFLLSGYPCYDMRETCKDILNGNKEDDSQFSAIYELDDDDDWKDEANWIKCAPSLGETVTYDYLRDQVKMATNNVAQEVGVKTKNFNMFCQSRDVWIKDEYVTKSFIKRFDLDKYKGEECYIGVDLSAVSDMSAMAVLIPTYEKGNAIPIKWTFKNYIYLPDDVLDTSRNAELYKIWKREKHIHITPGNVIDYDHILRDLIKIDNTMDVQMLAYDSFNATQWAISVTNETRLPLKPFNQGLGNFNRPTKDFERLMKMGSIEIEYNPAVRWCMSNVELKFDHQDNCKPVKANGDVARKIDPVIAMLQALGAWYECHLKPQPDGTVIIV